MKIAYATAELGPFAKAGGLADVAAALPASVRAAGHDVRVIVPYYTRAASHLERAWDTGRFVAVAHAGRSYHFGIYHHVTPQDVDIYFLRFDELFGREGIYGGRDFGYADNALRFALFQQAVLELFAVDAWVPEVLHLNDWHTALLPAYLAVRAETDPRFAAVRTVFTVHNLAYQGIFPLDQFPMLNLPERFCSPAWIEHFSSLNMIKCALLHADWLTTVSPTYAREVQTHEQGCGFDGIFRDRAATFSGILNGIDTDIWNPMTDPYLPEHYDAKLFLGKYRCKRQLLKQLGLRMQPRKPLCGIIARMTEQKGIDLVLAVMDALIQRGAQIAVLGTGNPAYEDAFRHYAKRYPDAVSATLTFSEQLAHRIEAAADMYLMPSRFEPCGLNQMYSLAYGTIPVVQRTGGLADTVVDTTPASLADGTATGFVCDHDAPDVFWGTLSRAIDLYERQPMLWRQLRRNAMAQDFSWPRRAQAYIELYQRISRA